VVVFKAQVRECVDLADCERTLVRMVELASGMPGFIDSEGLCDSDGGELAVVVAERIREYGFRG
jgi:hypothetical protein